VIYCSLYENNEWFTLLEEIYLIRSPAGQLCHVCTFHNNQYKLQMSSNIIYSNLETFDEVQRSQTYCNQTHYDDTGLC